MENEKVKFRNLLLIKKIFPINKGRHVLVFTGALLSNFLSALLEGLSFGLILLAFTALSEGSKFTFNN